MIGFFGASGTEDAGVVLTWIWMGIGFSVTYLLYMLLETLQRIADTV